ncbi:MAG: dynamin family protein [Peptococcaceae bacterium]|nr:dynamin family protein [Peptococcaceae bacterium]
MPEGGIILEKSYSALKTEVQKNLELLENVAVRRKAVHLQDYLTEIKQKLLQDRFNLVVLGEFKRGKTTLLNALLGTELLPTAVVPLTSIVTVIQYGDQLKVTVFFLNGGKKDIGISELFQYVTEEGNPENEKGVKLVRLEYPSPYLKEGVLLIDTPGIGSIYQKNTDETYKYLPWVDAAIFMLSSDQPLSRMECDFLSDIRQHAAKTFFVLNKIDYLAEGDRQRAMEYAKRALKKEAGFENIKIIPLSAKMALEGKLGGDEEKVRNSNLPEFTKSLEEFFMSEKGAASLTAVCIKGIRAAGELQAGLDLEEKALLIPLEELQAKIGLFNRMVETLSQEHQDNRYIFKGEMEKVYQVLEQEIARFQESRTSSLKKEVERLYQEKRSLSSRELLKFLRTFIEKSVLQSLEEWQPVLEEKVRAAFAKVVARFTDKTNRVIGELMRQSAEIFEISLEGFTRLEALTDESGLFYRIGEKINLLPDPYKVSALFLPRFLAHPVIYQEMKRKVQRELDRNCGRIRSDYNERIAKSAGVFQNAFQTKFLEAVEGTRALLARATDMRRRSGEEIGAALAEIRGLKEQAAGAKKRLAAVMESVRAG